MIPLAIPTLGGNEARYLQECIESTYVSSVGVFVDRFESSVAELSGSKAAVAASSGTCGLHVAQVALGIGPGDLVIVPNYTFVATANAVSHCGAKPWLVDVDPTTWSLCPNLLRQALELETTRTDAGLIHHHTGERVAAIMPVYTLGCPADMDLIIDIAREYEIAVVADAAAALGATYKGREIGELGADLTVFSFNGNKTVTAGGGGAVAGNDTVLLEKVKHLSTTARVGSDYDHDAVGFNFRMTNLQAAVGLAQLEQLDGFVAAKRRIRERYDKAFGSISGLGPFPSPAWARSACWFSGVVVDIERYGPLAVLRERLRSADVDSRPFWKPMHLQKPYADCMSVLNGTSAFLAERILTLPCSTNLADEQQTKVIEAVSGVLPTPSARTKTEP